MHTDNLLKNDNFLARLYLSIKTKNVLNIYCRLKRQYLANLTHVINNYQSKVKGVNKNLLGFWKLPISLLIVTKHWIPQKIKREHWIICYFFPWCFSVFFFHFFLRHEHISAYCLLILFCKMRWSRKKEEKKKDKGRRKKKGWERGRRRKEEEKGKKRKEDDFMMKKMKDGKEFSGSRRRGK